MVKVKFKYAKKWFEDSPWKEEDTKADRKGRILNGEVLDILSNLQNLCEAGGYKFTYYLKPDKSWVNAQSQGTIRVSVKRTTRYVQKPTKMMLIKVVLHKLEEVLDLRW